jgi:hypothetical protein
MSYVIDPYDIADIVTLSGAFTNSGGVATDPTTITFDLTEPDAVTTSYVYGTDSELVKDSTGNYHVAWPITKSGLHAWRMAGTGAVETAQEGVFYARPTLIVPVPTP